MRQLWVTFPPFQVTLAKAGGISPCLERDWGKWDLPRSSIKFPFLLPFPFSRFFREKDFFVSLSIQFTVRCLPVPLEICTRGNEVNRGRKVKALLFFSCIISLLVERERGYQNGTRSPTRELPSHLTCDGSSPRAKDFDGLFRRLLLRLVFAIASSSSPEYKRNSNL